MKKAKQYFMEICGYFQTNSFVFLFEINELPAIPTFLYLPSLSTLGYNLIYSLVFCTAALIKQKDFFFGKTVTGKKKSYQIIKKKPLRSNPRPRAPLKSKESESNDYLSERVKSVSSERINYLLQVFLTKEGKWRDKREKKRYMK